MKTSEINSIGIRKFFGLGVELEKLGSIGEGDKKQTLWAGNGREVIETNGDPCWDYQDGFEQAKSAILAKKSL